MIASGVRDGGVTRTEDPWSDGRPLAGRYGDTRRYDHAPQRTARTENRPINIFGPNSRDSEI